MTPLESLLIYDALLLLWMVAWGIYTRWKVNATLYITFFLFLCGVISTVYYPFADGLIHDYSNITLVPFLYLVMCFIITTYPVMSYDLNGCKTIYASDAQHKLLEMFCLFLIVVSIEPFLENMMLLPKMVTDEAAIDSMYDDRAFTEYEEPLSWMGRKLFKIMTTFQYLYPILLFYFISKSKVKWYLVAGILMMIASHWAHNVNIGGRSQMVQEILYIIVVYFVMRRFIPKAVNRKITFYGSIVIGLGIFAMLVVSLARFNANQYADGSVWIWLGLYAGEGNVNFNSMMWDVIRSTGGEGTLILPMDILGLTKDTSIIANWDAVEKLGIPGNIFYTYVGVIYADFGRIGTIVFVSVLAIVTRLATIVKGRDIPLTKIIYISLLAKIVVLPTFYTYGAYTSQLKLLFTLLFCVAYSLCGRLYYGNRRLF